MSKIRLKQIDQPEISGYILNVMTGINSGFNASITGCVYTGATLSGAFGSLFNSFTGISGSYATFSGQLFTVQQDFSTFSGDIDALSGQIYSVSGQFNSLSGDIAFLSGEINTLDGSLSTLQSDFNTLSGNLVTTNSILTITSGKVDTLSGHVTGISGNLNTVSGKLSDLSGSYTGFSGKYRNDHLYVCDMKASGAAGGTFTATGWKTRDINVKVSDSGNICTISSNQLLLSGGDYICDILCPAYAVGVHKTRLRNISSSTTLVSGTKEYCTTNIQNHSRILGRFTLPSTGAIVEIQHTSQLTVATNGFGVGATNELSDRESSGIFTSAYFRRISL